MKVKFLLKLGKYAAAALLSLILAMTILQLWNSEWLQIPFAYGGDSTFYCMIVKSIVTTGWYLNDPSIGAPAGYCLADFPMSENLNLGLIKIIALFSSNWFWILNVFYLITFPLCALSAFYVFSQLGLKYAFALTASLLFSLLPYHFMRGTEHVFLSAYYMVPFGVWLAVLTYQNKLHRASRRVTWGIVFACIALGFSGIYYAFFGCFFILVAGVIASFEKKRFLPFINAGAVICVITASILINLSPTFIHQMKYGTNHVVAKRGHQESEVYGLKIAQLLLPIDHDRIPSLSKIKKTYNRGGVLINENTMASLGAIGSLGFLILLGRLFYTRRENGMLDTLSQLTLAGILLATVGGFSSLFALFVTPSIRAYNRISVYLAFFAFAAFFCVLQKILQKKEWLPRSSWVASCILLLGIFNQTSSQYGLNKKSKGYTLSFKKDAEFIRQIESILPQNSMIFQLPYVAFPESGPAYGMNDYDHFKAPLHTQRLKFSYGAIRGRDVDAWQRAVAKEPVGIMIERLREKGFSGLYINRTGYEDGAQAIESQLTSILSKPPISNDTISFWDLTESQPQ